MSDADAFALSRYATSQTAEAFFAKALIVVEGFSDLLALRTLTKLRGKDLDASGVSLLSLDGSGTFKHYLQLFGPEGLGVELRGLCDQDAERDWIEKLSAAGIGVADRASLEENGFFVCDPDLEAEMLSALEPTEITRVINEDGAEATFSSFASHPANSGLTEHEIQVAFFKNEKVRWAPLFAAAMSPTALPQPIERLLSLL
jgi:predicted ATP-dependent endonuclease of OLD family